ncbi:2,4-dienoyl-CoA reductase-like NADH-dependent reductase (Old Yellow Enzyme family) [Brevibacterium sanguinis]|uniref:2,4-dienoyl-CoA reductase-like NADH-dependent reductase (Old Yellow Enzyme family) n=2 Tax=Brevibacterium TaxID=1696 RepID=A0A366ILU4_9MICO|nr:MULTISPECIES: FAD-dependent oxidoreductase [Brevibacterium]RBP67181.1 2,4-dienoyl-CoA reductase-like NADH-dependent reductase (Old Yellow Enzyme family) [Brevibacterium sanguinis]RBP73706.1 2,4-dienoyl-CoA reductase-like NADH-dependent reductase (Old Yellow Enzyme family) [Brevibacterium celere]
MINDALLRPGQLGPVLLKNRIVSTAHEPAYTEDAMPKERYRLYHKEKVRGGVGLTMIGGSACVSADSPAAFGNIDLSRDEVVPWLSAIAEDAHAENAAIMIQITHLGMRSSNFAGDWLPLVSSSRNREATHRSFTKAMEEFDFERITGDFAAAAQRVVAAGFDGLEIFHTGHIFDSFFEPWLNHRTDEYNGALLERAKFFLDVIDAVRAAVPKDFAVGTRMGVDDRREGGITEADAIELLGHYTDHGIDFLNLNVGTIDNDRRLAEAIPGMGTPSAPWLETCRRIRAAIDIPVMHAARIADAPTARYAVEDGCVDFVGMTRAQLADPYLVRKIEQKREDDIRPCVGANLCLDSIYTSGSATCIHNPATGREQTLPQEIGPDSSDRAKHVVIVGAGPAGLEAARVAAVRGHRVTVFEADCQPGGQVRIAARSERRRDLIGIVDWRQQQCEKHGVEFRFDMLADVDDVTALDPDVVIIATGGTPDTDYGLDTRATINDTWDVMNDQLRKKKEVIVYDDHGSYPALDAVERLARNGQSVTYISPERTIGIDVGAMNSPAYLRMISEFGVRVILGERLIDVARAEGRRVRATVRNEYSDLDTEFEADALVIDHGTIPNDDLYHELKPLSLNHGRTDLKAWVDGRPQPMVLRSAVGAPVPIGAGGAGHQGGSADGRERAASRDGAQTFGSPEFGYDGSGALVPVADPEWDSGFRLFRIGDAVSSRNIHAAVLEGLRIGVGL